MKKLFTLLALVWCAATGAWADTYEWSYDGQQSSLSVTAAKGTGSANAYSGYTISYGGKTYTKAVKMESATTITFTTTKTATITVGVALKNGVNYASASKTALQLMTVSEKEGKKDTVKVAKNTGITSATTGNTKEEGLSVVFQSVGAGTQVITRAGSEEGVFYIKVEEADETKVLTPSINATWGASYGDATSVTISCSTADASIYYTTDGTDPSASSTSYTAPFTVASACTVKAIAMKSGMTNSEVASQDITINNLRKVNFDFSGVTLTQGSAPAKETPVNGTSYTLPSGRLYYIDGQTQTGWNDGTTNYELGAAVTVDKDYTFTPVFVDNTVAVGESEATVNWTFATKDGAPSGGIEKNIGYYATQTTINGTKLDVVMKINTSTGAAFEGVSGKWNTTSADNRAQVNKGTVFTIPAVKGMTITYTATNGKPTAESATFAGEAGTVDGSSLVYTYNGSAETIDIIDGGSNLYPSGLVVTYPAAQTKANTPTITAAGFDFEKKNTAVTIASTDEGATLYYSYDNNTWTQYTEALSLTAQKTVYAKASVEGLEDSEVASLTAGENFNPLLPFLAVVYQTNYNDDTKNAAAMKVAYSNLVENCNVILVGAPNYSTSWTDLCPTLPKANIVLITEAMSGGKTFSNGLKDLVGQANVIHLKAYNYTSNRWSWGTPAQAASKDVIDIIPTCKEFKLFDGCTFNANGGIDLYDNTALFDGTKNHIQCVKLTDEDVIANSTVMAYTGDSEENVTMHTMGDNYLFIGLPCDNFAAANKNTVQILKNAAKMMLLKQDLDAINPVELTISSVGYSTFAADHAVTIPADVEAYIVKTAPTGDFVTITSITGDIAAGEGIIVKGTAGAKATFAAAASAEKNTENLLVGTVKATELEEDAAYILAAKNGNAVFSLCSAGTIAAGKAYLPNTTASAARSLQFVTEDANSIKNATESKTQKSGAYNLAGQKVSANYKGIVIENGVKMIKK